eukprot:CAMPEP_0181229314 /NCGR_PEP_ID=MMETSP1096-20121128/33827_1 /TAXON_ID=156174 ORGANISM="Chrysochromulina ericina, Strain CCMP281" /NCGR_SAMPLE_ID=MMETSP1096 /ASSEMBLY_ACC=CAM_ASM_000453 /LENGTH=189 /DNA_ID=CAMNT_0023322921 /DNA_START=90 /DNA_END=659 /DNA_ORIENTATION=+
MTWEFGLVHSAQGHRLYVQVDVLSFVLFMATVAGANATGCCSLHVCCTGALLSAVLCAAVIQSSDHPIIRSAAVTFAGPALLAVVQYPFEFGPHLGVSHAFFRGQPLQRAQRPLELSLLRRQKRLVLRVEDKGGDRGVLDNGRYQAVDEGIEHPAWSVHRIGRLGARHDSEVKLPQLAKHDVLDSTRSK